MPWRNQAVIAELSSVQPGLPVLPIIAVAVNFSSLNGFSHNLWQSAAGGRTTLSPPIHSAASALPFPDCLLTLLPGRQAFTPAQQFCSATAAIVAVFLVVAMLCSSTNNCRFIETVVQDLALYHQLDGQPPEPKVRAQQQLRSDQQ